MCYAILCKDMSENYIGLPCWSLKIQSWHSHRRDRCRHAAEATHACNQRQHLPSGGQSISRAMSRCASHSWTGHTRPLRRRTSHHTQRPVTAPTMTMTPAAMMPLTPAEDRPEPSRHSPAHFCRQTSLAFRRPLGCAASADSSVTPQLDSP